MSDSEEKNDLKKKKRKTKIEGKKAGLRMGIDGGSSVQRRGARVPSCASQPPWWHPAVPADGPFLAAAARHSLASQEALLRLMVPAHLATYHP